MSGWRTAIRVARREASRARGRSALVVALIALPVAAVAFLAVAYDTFTLNPDEQADRLMGSAQVVVSWPRDQPIQQDPGHLLAFPIGAPTSTEEPTEARLLGLLPDGSRVITDQPAGLAMRTATGTATIGARLLDYADPLAKGMFRQLSGRAPSVADEVALTPAASTRLGAAIGGTVASSDGGRILRVVGTVEDPENLAATTMLLRPGAIPADREDLRWLVATPGPVTWSQIKELNKHGVVGVSRQVLADPPSAAQRYTGAPQFGEGPALSGTLALVGGLAMLEIVLLAGPAFAVGARRRRRDLALVAASGGTPGHLRMIVLADGLVLGAVAALAGAVLGVLAGVFSRTMIEGWLNHRSGALRVFPVAQAVLVGLAVLTGVLAALVPAWISARQDVVTALAGRRGITRSRRRWLVAGLLLMLAGGAGAVLGASNLDLSVVLLGLIGFELGLVLCTPALVGLVAGIGRLLPVAARIALRDTSRNRTAAAPAISAVMAAVVGSLAIAVVLSAQARRDADAYTGRLGDVVVATAGANRESPEVASEVRDTMPVEQVYQIDEPTCRERDCFTRAVVPSALECPYFIRVLGHPPNADEQRAARQDSRCSRAGDQYVYFGVFSSTFGMTLVIDPEAAGVVANLSAEDAAKAQAALRAGQVVVDDPRYLQQGQVSLSVGYFGTDETGPTLTAPGFVLPHLPKAPMIMMTRPTAEKLGFSARPLLTLATTSRMPTVAEQDRLQAAVGDQFEVRVARGGTESDRQLLILAIVAGVIALGAAALATGLAAADGRADLATLAAVGASPRLRRVLSLSQSGVIAGLGSLLGAVAGLGASSVVLYALNQRYVDVWPALAPYPVTVPWVNLGIALVVVPAVAMLGAGLLTRSRLPIERRR